MASCTLCCEQDPLVFDSVNNFYPELVDLLIRVLPSIIKVQVVLAPSLILTLKWIDKLRPRDKIWQTMA